MAAEDTHFSRHDSSVLPVKEERISATYFAAGDLIWKTSIVGWIG